MTVFLAAAGTITLAVLAWLFMPVLRTSDGDAEPLAMLKYKVVALALLIILLAVGLYAMLGRPQRLVHDAVVVQTPAPELTQSLAALTVRLQREPDDGLGWMTLARARFELGLYADAVRAYARAHRLLGDEPQLLAEYAEAVALQHEGTFTPEARALLARALYLQADNVHALWLAGLAAYADGERGAAVAHWRTALVSASPGSREAQRLAQAIDTAEAGAGK